MESIEEKCVHPQCVACLVPLSSSGLPCDKCKKNTCHSEQVGCNGIGPMCRYNAASYCLRCIYSRQEIYVCNDERNTPFHITVRYRIRCHQNTHSFSNPKECPSCSVICEEEDLSFFKFECPRDCLSCRLKREQFVCLGCITDRCNYCV